MTRSPRCRWRRWASAALVVLALGLVVRVYLFDVSLVREVSMWPCLTGGVDRVLIKKFGSEPTRWQVCVYRLPEDDGTKTAIGRRVKRVLAVGGEFLDLRGGDLWVGRHRDALERPPRAESIVSSMLVPVFPPPPEDGDALKFEVPPGSGTWTRRGPGLVLEAGPYNCQGHLAIRDRYVGSDGVWRDGNHVVTDVRVDIRVDSLEGAGPLVLRHELGEHEFRAVEITRTDVRILRDGTPPDVVASWKIPSWPLNLRMETIDGVFRVAAIQEPRGPVDRVHYAAPRDTAHLSAGLQAYSQFSLGLADGVATIGELDVARDVHYFWPAEEQRVGPREVEAGAVFLVGDNVPASTDCREHGAISKRHLTGKVIGVIWPRLHGFP